MTNVSSMVESIPKPAQDGVRVHDRWWSNTYNQEGTAKSEAARTDTIQKLYPGYIMDPLGDVNDHGKPIYDASLPQHYMPSEKDMSDSQRMSWKQYQLWRLTMKIDRRDNVYAALSSSDYTNYKPSHHWLGSPYPMIEPNPHIIECFWSIRWYEHLLAICGGFVYYQYVRSKPVIRYSHLNMWVQKSVIFSVWAWMEVAWMERAAGRLMGSLANEPECYKYGVVETPQRLEEKAKYWTQFKAYKEEWCKRYDYYLWGIRPGERYSLFSGCFAPPYPVLFNTKTDYPQRKNPFLVSSKPIRKLRLDSMMSYYYAPDADSYLEQQRPELKYLFRGGMGI